MIISPKLSSDTLGVPNDLKYIMTSDTCNVEKNTCKTLWWPHLVEFKSHCRFWILLDFPKNLIRAILPLPLP